MEGEKINGKTMMKEGRGIREKEEGTEEEEGDVGKGRRGGGEGADGRRGD